MNAAEVDTLKEGLYRVIWNDAHRSSLGLVLGQPLGYAGAPPRILASERSFTQNAMWDTRNPWPRVERVEPLAICHTAAQCKVRQELQEQAKHATKRLALAEQIGETALPTIRDLFLEGRDAEALGMLTTELGMERIASRGAPLRPLKVDDPVVVVAYGRITKLDYGHGRCYRVALFSDGLGYSVKSLERSVWVEHDELRFAYPPVDVHYRMPRVDSDNARLHGDTPTRLGRVLEMFEMLSEGERMSVMQQCCTACGKWNHGCDCAKRAVEGTF